MADWLLTWLWQGTLLTLLVTVALRALPGPSAATKCLVWWATLAALLILPWNWSGTQVGSAIGPVVVTTAAGSPGWTPIGLPSVPAWLAAIVAATWIGLAAVRLVALTRAIAALERLKRRCVDLPSQVEARLPLWRAIRAEGRRARLCLSDEVRVSSVLGLREPVIAVPPSLVEELSDDELDQIVLHEYAHVRRWDDWGRLAQLLLTAVAGLHPGVWWASRRLSLEREVACDDWVISRTASARAYASCLTKVATAAAWRRAHGLAPSAVRSAREISLRVMRILDHRRNVSVRPSAPALATGLASLAVSVATLAMLPPLVVTERRLIVDLMPPAARALTVPPFARPQALAEAERTWAAESPAVPQPASRSAGGTRRPLDTSPISAPWMTWTTPPPNAQPLARLALEPARPPALVATAGPADPALLRGPIEIPRVQPLTWQPDASSAGASSPWRKLARAGASVGTGFSKAGGATAKVFTSLGASIGRAFRHDH